MTQGRIRSLAAMSGVELTIAEPGTIVGISGTETLVVAEGEVILVGRRAYCTRAMAARIKAAAAAGSGNDDAA